LKTSKPPTDALLKQQAERLLTLPNSPSTCAEILIALKRFAQTDYHAKAIVQHLLDTQTFFPAPVAVRDASEICLTEPPPKFRTPNPNCSVCLGSGHAVMERDGKTFAGICDCRKIGAPMPPDREPGKIEAPDLREIAAAHTLPGGRR
jgi:hypothetical protein